MRHLREGNILTSLPLPDAVMEFTHLYADDDRRMEAGSGVLHGVCSVREAMMDTGDMLILSRTQAEQLSNLCAAYRSYAWQKLAPSPERNQAMKAVQAVQGRLSEMRGRGVEQLSFAIAKEEQQALRAAMSTLMQVYGAEASSSSRDQLLENLYVLRVLIERMGRQTTAF